MRVLSLGAGVQSTTVLLMSLVGDLPPFDAAIFADTGWEPGAVYAHLWQLVGRCVEAELPVYVVSAGNIRDDALDPAHAFASMPLYTGSGHGSQLRRQCTREYKVTPIEHELRRQLGLPTPYRHRQGAAPLVELHMGISLDEVVRMKPNRLRWIRHEFPLIDRRMTRWSCKVWMQRHGFDEPPRSACVGCPYRSDEQWRQMRDTSPDEWADAIEFDDAIRSDAGRAAASSVREDAPPFVHRSLIPLRAVDLSSLEDRGQGDLFDGECEGMCGV